MWGRWAPGQGLPNGGIEAKGDRKRPAAIDCSRTQDSAEYAAGKFDEPSCRDSGRQRGSTKENQVNVRFSLSCH